MIILKAKMLQETAKNTIEALYRKSQHKRHLPVIFLMIIGNKEWDRFKKYQSDLDF